jgi:hypothetical protein
MLIKIVNNSSQSACLSGQNNYNGIMEQVVVQLIELNKKVDSIVGIMKKPENRVIKILEMAVAVAGVLSILSIIDVARNWLGL